MKELAEQVDTIERALGECMIETATTVLRVWLNELGENNPYEEALQTIRAQYQEVFTKWLNIDIPESDTVLNKITGDAYQLADAVYADVRTMRGLSPAMHGFNPNSAQSVITYFQNCIRLSDKDLDWLHDAMREEEQNPSALLAITALTRNLRECFSMDAFITLIEGMAVEDDVVANLCTTNVISLLIHYDVRIDFFPQIQDAFIATIGAKGDQGDSVFETLCAFVEFSKKSYLEDYATGLMPMSWLPPVLQKLIEATGIKEDFKTFYSWVPKEETEYMMELVQNLPNTWLYEVLVSGNPYREQALTYSGVSVGYRAYMWNHPEVAEQFYLEVLRKGTEKPIDYINYAHCLLLKGDRMMAFENYKQARQLCGSLRTFYDMFRPDRRQLVEHGVPLDYVYAIEDNLVNG